MNEFLTTVSPAEGAGQPINVAIISPGCDIDEEVRRVPDGESKSEPLHTNICMSTKGSHRKMLQRISPPAGGARTHKSAVLSEGTNFFCRGNF